MPSYQFLAVARIQFRQRDIVYFGKQDIGGFSFLHDREPELRCKNVQQDVQLFLFRNRPGHTGEYNFS